MSQRTSTVISYFLALIIPGVGAAQDSVPETLSDRSAPALGPAGGSGTTPSPFKVETWVAVRPNVKLNDGKNDVVARPIPALYYIEKVDQSGQEPRYWLSGDESGWAVATDLWPPEDALVKLADLIQQSPREPSLFDARGLIEIGIERYLPAIADFDDELRLDPTSANAYFHRANANRANAPTAGTWSKFYNERALGDLYEAIRLNPNNSQPYLARAQLTHAMKLDLRALEDYTTALRLNPECTQAKEGLEALAHQVGSLHSGTTAPTPQSLSTPVGQDTSQPASHEATATPMGEVPSTTPPKTPAAPGTPVADQPVPSTPSPLQAALEQAAIVEANARTAEAQAKIEELRARTEEARARAEKAMLDAELFRRQRIQVPTAEPVNKTPDPPKPEEPSAKVDSKKAAGPTPKPGDPKEDPKTAKP
jgi:tetratricopeptide (TPR) repeat protein